MILGLGTDLVHIPRITKVRKHFGARFEARVFTETEHIAASKSNNPDAYYAKRFAAKEAFAKALGTGFRDGLFLRHITIISDVNKKPAFELSAEAQKKLQSITPEGSAPKIELSLSSDEDYATATAIIWACNP